MNLLHNSLIFMQIATSVAIFYAPNPMRAILLMIFLFFEASLCLALFSFDTFALLFILIYVGAVAVLFLFVIMLLQIKSKNVNKKLSLWINFAASLMLAAAFEHALSGASFATGLNSLSPVFSNTIDYLSDLAAVGQVLFNGYLSCFLIVGYILLIALVGAIALLFNFSNVKASPDMHRALSKSTYTLSASAAPHTK